MKFFQELTRESVFRLGWKGVGLCAREFRQGGQLVLDVVRRNPVPQTVFEREHLNPFLLDGKDLSVRELDQDSLGMNINVEFFVQIEASFHGESSMQLDPLRAPGPRVQQLVLDFHLALEHGELRDGRGLLQINTIVNRDARLQLSQPNEFVTRLTAHAFQGCRRPTRPRFSAVKKEGPEQRQDENDEGESERTTEPSSGGCGGIFDRRHYPKKVPPPTPEGHEGRLFPPEQSFKSADQIVDLNGRCKKIFGSNRNF